MGAAGGPSASCATARFPSNASPRPTRTPRLVHRCRARRFVTIPSPMPEIPSRAIPESSPPGPGGHNLIQYMSCKMQNRGNDRGGGTDRIWGFGLSAGGPLWLRIRRLRGRRRFRGIRFPDLRRRRSGVRLGGMRVRWRSHRRGVILRRWWPNHGRRRGC